MLGYVMLEGFLVYDESLLSIGYAFIENEKDFKEISYLALEETSDYIKKDETNVVCQVFLTSISKEKYEEKTSLYDDKFLTEFESGSKLYFTTV